MEEKPKELEVPADLGIEINDGAGDKPDYKTMPAEEAIKLNVVSVTETTSTWQGEVKEIKKEQYRIVFKVAEGQVGEGQLYSDWVGKPKVFNGKLQMHPKSGLYKLLTKMYPDGLPEGKTFTEMLLGQPVRAEFKAPNTNGYQYIEAYKSPTKDQKAIEVGPSGDDMGAAVEAFLKGE